MRKLIEADNLFDYYKRLLIQVCNIKSVITKKIVTFTVDYDNKIFNFLLR
jgi:hypothetical protein